ncbi:MAG: TM2 domain-containing protein, partial [Clostridia bacterium]|nr:TM2 domain-containing protein [Clostridia bacterium]
MTNEKIENIAEKFQKEISSAQLDEVKQRLDSVPDEKYSAVEAVKTKSCFLTVLLSALLGLFGAGSFYLGYYKRGIVKVVFNVLVPLALGIVFLFWLSPLHLIYSNESEEVYNTVHPVIVLVTEPQQHFKTGEQTTSEYKSFVAAQSNLISPRNNLNAAYAYLSGDVLKNDVALLAPYLTQLSESGVLIRVKDEVEAALALIENNDSNKGLFDLPDNVTDFSNAINEVAAIDTDTLSALSGCADNLSLKVSALNQASKIEDITAALNALNEALPQIKQVVEGFYPYISTVSSDGINSLSNLLKTLLNKFKAEDEE